MVNHGEEMWIQKGPELNLALPDVNLGFHLLNKLKDRTQPRVQVDGETEEAVSAQEMTARCLSIAFELKKLGVRPGEVVTTVFDNCIEYTYVLLGAMHAGVVFSPLNPNWGPDDIQHMLNLLSPRVVFSSERVAEMIRPLVTKAQLVVVKKGDATWESFVGHGGLSLDSFPPAPERTADDTAVIMCSSGTTGAPKGVELTHRNLHAVMILSGLDSLKALKTQPVHVLVAPGFWMSGFFATLLAIDYNISQVLLRGFEVVTMLKTIEKYKANILAMSPFQIVQIAKHPTVESYDLSSLFFLSYAGAPLSLAMKGQAEKRLGRPLIQVYGLTESLFTVVQGPKSMEKPNTVGIAAPNTMVKVIDVDTGRTVGPNTEGELCFKGPMVFKGYYKNTEATADVIDSDGWMHSGDIGYFDEDGYFFVLDRIKELIKQKGIQVIPGDVEDVLLSHVGVKDAAVVGIEHDTEQEQAVGFVIKQSGATVSEDDLLNLIKSKLPEYKWLNGGLRFVEQIPRTASGKVIRRELRQKARSAQDPSHTQLAGTGSVRKICQQFEKQTGHSLNVQGQKKNDRHVM